MAKYRVCEICGANLDPGEKCRCEEERRKEIEVRHSETGRFLLCNSGGRRTIESIGCGQVLAGRHGELLRCYKRLGGFNWDHDFCQVEMGFYVIQAKEFSYGFPLVDVYRIEDFTERDGTYYAVCRKIFRNYHGEKVYWDTPTETVEILSDAIAAAIYMSETVMCKIPVV